MFWVILLSVTFLLIMLFFALIIIRNIMLTKQYEANLKAVYENSQFRNPSSAFTAKKKKPEFLSRDKKQERAIEEVKRAKAKGLVPVKRLVDKEEMVEEAQEEGKQIVAIAEPKGFWSRFILSQKLGYILGRASAQKQSGQGFWVNLIKAQSMGQGKDQGQGRGRND
jgi:uncharacterized protein (DUF2342 family)